jgi:hypothetical protein
MLADAGARRSAALHGTAEQATYPALLDHMKHRDVEYSVVQGIGRNVWKWSVSFAGLRVAGQTTTKAAAITRAERAIDRALTAKKLRLVYGRDRIDDDN